MLKSRILTALVLIPLVILSIFFLPPLAFFSLALVLILAAGWEWAQLIKLSTAKSFIYLILLAIGLILFIWIPLSLTIIISLIGWISALLLLMIYPKGVRFWRDNKVIKGLMGFIVLAPFWVGLIILQGFSPLVLLYVLVLVWSVDIAAYFFGKKWGKRKLAPSISPGKTYEGVLGGIVVAALVSFLGIWILDVESGTVGLFYFFSLVGGGVVTVLGDLFESMVKRVSHVKDSGTLLPGHGGLLDRIDSLTTAIPFFALVFPYLFNV